MGCEPGERCLDCRWLTFVNEMKRTGFKRTVSTKRAKQIREYTAARFPFLDAHPICPVTGRVATEIHHTAHREGEWLLLQRYWVGVSSPAHRYIESHKDWARSVGLIVQVNSTYDSHIEYLRSNGESETHPIFYDTWDGQPLNPTLT